MFSGKRVALSLAGIGALVVGVYSGLSFFSSCNENFVCAASVYFGVPETEVVYPDISAKTFDTTMAVSAQDGFGVGEVHALVQTVGLYLLLLGVFLLIVLEMKELKLLKNRKRKFA